MSKIMPVNLKSIPLPHYPDPSGSFSASALAKPTSYQSSSPSGSEGACAFGASEALSGKQASNFEAHYREATCFDPTENRAPLSILEDTSGVDESLFDDTPKIEESLISTSVPLNSWLVFPPSETFWLDQNAVLEFSPFYAKAGASVKSCYFVPPSLRDKYREKLKPVRVVPYYLMSEPTLRFYVLAILPGKPSWVNRLEVLKRFVVDKCLKTQIFKIPAPNGDNSQRPKMFWKYEEQDTSTFDWTFNVKSTLLAAALKQKLILG